MFSAVVLGLPRIGIGPYMNEAMFFVAVSLGVKLPIMQIFRLFDVSWRYVSIRDLVTLVIALGVGTAIIIAVAIGANAMGTRTAFVVQWLLLDYQLG